MPDPDGDSPQRAAAERLWPSAAGVFLLSAAVILLELALMRCLSVARWHHFAYLVISTALLGFGASGTLLTMVGGALRRRFSASAAALSVLFAGTAVVAFQAAEALPFEPRYVLYSGRDALLMSAYHAALVVPFLLGATVVGLALMRFTERQHLVYAANMVGSGLGGALALGLMFVMPPERLLYVAGGMGVLAALAWALTCPRRRLLLSALTVAAGAALALHAARRPVALRVDQYKALSVLRELAAQGDARHLATAFSPRGRLDVYASRLQHQTMFAGLTAAEPPPPQLTILADGDLAGTVFAIRSADEAAILDHTPMSVAYRLLERPRVLLLGEVGGTNVWLARRMGAAHVTVVQANPQLVALMRGPLAGAGGGVLSGPDVTVVVEDPRVFLERTRERFGLIQIVTAEAMAAGVSHLRSLHEDFLLTRDGLARCVDRLEEGGIVSVTRGVQAPPRDNVKLFATMRAALESAGGPPPDLRMAQVRNYLAAATLAFHSPVSPEQCRRLAEIAGELALDVEWAPCPDLDYARQVNQVDGPPGRPYSYFHSGAVRVLSRRREEFFRQWPYDVRPPTDDRPYFYNFFRWRSLPHFVRAYGRDWLRRTELGYVVLVVALAEALVAGAALILLPLLWLRSPGRGERPRTAAYFVLVGLGYMLVEMACLMKFTFFLGDPMYAAACTISGFLVFSGLGSAASRRLFASPGRAVSISVTAVGLLAVGYAFGLGPALRALIGLPLPARAGLALLLMAPLAFAMGWPFPNGLALVQRRAPRLVPWAWGANGFASVAAPPLAVLMAIAAGYRSVLVTAGLLYLLASVLAPRAGEAGSADGSAGASVVGPTQAPSASRDPRQRRVNFVAWLRSLLRMTGGGRAPRAGEVRGDRRAS